MIEERIEENDGLVLDRYNTSAGTHPYETVEWKKWDAEIRDPDGTVRYSQKDVKFPASWTQQSVNIVASKYFYTWDDKGREDSLRQLLDRIVDTITEAGVERDYFETEQDAETFNHELKWLMLHQHFAFNSPVWFNIGTPERQQASACFINEVEDDMDSIMKLAHDEANIFKLGSGSGVNLSPIRSRGESLTGGGAASGPVSFMKGFDAFAGVIKSGGKNRRAAKMIILNDDHPDLEEFVWCKVKEEEKAFDLIEAGYDASFDSEYGAYGSVHFQNANHSVRVTDDFMRSVGEDDTWDLVNRNDGSVAREVSARDLFDQIAEAAWECGDPGLQFDDTIHQWHTCKGTGRQEASNPCSEYMFLNHTACNLASSNLLKYLGNEGFKSEKFKHTVRLGIIAQDILVSHSDYPNEKIDKGTRKWRTLGMGFSNLGSLLMTMGFPYDSEEGRSVAAKITSLMCGHAYRTSAEIAAVLDPFEGYNQDENHVSMNSVVQEHARENERLDSSHLQYVAGKSWEDAVRLGEKYGYRNAQVTVLAPTGTTSFAMACDTTGVEPAIGLVTYKTLVGGGNMKLTIGCVPRALENMGYTEGEIREITQYIREEGEVEDAPCLSEEDVPVFDCAFKSGGGQRTINWKGHVDMMSAVQPFISGAISKTVNLPEDATVDDIKQAYKYAWENGIKAIAVYRDNCKNSQPVSTEKKDVVDTEDYVAERKKLPMTRQSLTHKFKVGGQKGYVNVGLYDNGKPGEVFITMNKEGSTISGLLDAFATSVSIGLQYGAPLEDLVRKFKYTNFDPAGFTNNPEIRQASSIIDYIFKWMEQEFLLDLEEKEDHTSEEVEHVEKNVSANEYDAPLCSNCGNQTQRSGSCYACTVCGETTGCG